MARSCSWAAQLASLCAWMPAFAGIGIWSFYIWSRRRGACQGPVGERDIKVGQQLGMLDHLFA